MRDPGLPQEEGNLRLLSRGAFAAIRVWVTYAVVGGLVSWTAFAWAAGDIWAGTGGIPAARAGGVGAFFAVVALLAYPATWLTLLYLLGFPALSVALGQQAAVRAGLARVARGRVDAASERLTARCWPVCDTLARAPGQMSVGRAARAFRERLDDEGRAERVGMVRRWLMRRTYRALRVPRLCAGTDFLDMVRDQPDAARARLKELLRARLVEWTAGGHLGALVLVVAGILALTMLRGIWLPLLP